MPSRNHGNGELRKFLRKRVKDLRAHADRLEALAVELPPNLSAEAEAGLYLELVHHVFLEK